MSKNEKRLDLNLNLNDDLIYLEGSYIENLTNEDFSNMREHYTRKLNKTKAQTKDNVLSIYNYRPQVTQCADILDIIKVVDKKDSLSDEDFEKIMKDVLSIKKAELSDPAIQPHDSKISKVSLNQNTLSIVGYGNSYMNYEDYDFDIKFFDTTNLKVTESFYENFEKKEVKELSLEDFAKRMPSLFFREVFLDKSATLQKEASYLFIDESDEGDVNDEKRSIITLSFEYAAASVKCEVKPENKPKMKH